MRWHVNMALAVQLVDVLPLSCPGLEVLRHAAAAAPALTSYRYVAAIASHSLWSLECGRTVLLSDRFACPRAAHAAV